MNILIDINHPCHVHLFRNFFSEMVSRGHKVVVTCKNIPAAHYLLNYYNIPFILINYRSDSIYGKAVAGLMQTFKMLGVVFKYGIEIGIGTSMNLAHLSLFTSMKSIILDDDDDDVEPLFVKFVHPFANTVLSPESVRANRRTDKAIFYQSYHELAYLHPKQFQPDKRILMKLNLNEDEKYFILRFNAFKAHHDVNEKGLSLEQKRRLISALRPHGKIFITSEREIDSEFKQFQIEIPPEEIHNAIYFASLFIGDSQTMTSESAILGTPALRCNSFVKRISYLQEQEERFELTYGFLTNEFDKLLTKIDEILSIPDFKGFWRNKSDILLKNNINTNEFLIWFVETYPESIEVMKSSPEFQNNFIGTH